MKKIFSVLALLTVSAVLLAPLAASAAEPIPAEITSCTMRYDLVGADWTAKGFNCPAKGAVCTFSTAGNTCGICCVMDTIYTVTGWFFVAIVILAMIMVLLGAYNIMTAGGAPEKVNTGRSYIIFAAVGLIIALIARAIPYIARNIMGM